MSAYPVLAGAEGLCLGEIFLLPFDRPMVVGRSSACDICLQKLPRYLALDADRRAALTDFNGISRQHLRITVRDTLARLENLSAAGTICNDQRFDKELGVDLADGRLYRLRFGGETLHLMLLDQREIERMRAKTVPMPAGDGTPPPATQRLPS